VSAKSDRLREFVELRRAGGTSTSAEVLASPSALGRNPHAGPIAAGERDLSIRNYIRLLVGKGHTRAELEALVERRWRDMEQPSGNGYPLAEALAKIDVALAKFSANTDSIAELVGDVEVPDELREHLKDREVYQAVSRMMAGRVATAIVGELEALKSPRPPVDFGSLKDMLKRDERLRWRVEGLLAIEARMLVVAQRKTGKTTLVINLMRSLLTGEPFLGRMPVEPVTGSVMFLNYEVSGATFASWVADVGIPKELHKRVQIVNMRGRENLLATERGRAQLAGMMRDVEAEVVIVDPFGRAFNGDEQNNTTQVTRWLVALDEVVTQGGASELILVAHAGWGDGKGAVRARGSSGLEDWPDVIVRYSRELSGAPRFFEAEGRDVSIETDRLEYDASTRLLRMTGKGGALTARRSAKAETFREPILAIVADMPGVSALGIEKGLRRLVPPIAFTRGDEAKAVSELVSEGLLERYRDGKTNRHYASGGTPPKFQHHKSE
jgi:hypothetical protein